MGRLEGMEPNTFQGVRVDQKSIDTFDKRWLWGVFNDRFAVFPIQAALVNDSDKEVTYVFPTTHRNTYSYSDEKRKKTQIILPASHQNQPL